MSRVGKLPIPLNSSTYVVRELELIKIKGPKGELTRHVHSVVDLNITPESIVVSPIDQSDFSRAMWGTTRSIINNMVKGVNHGFKSELELVGVGYRAFIKGKFLVLAIGKSHFVHLLVPDSLQTTAPKPNLIVIEGVDKDLVGQFVAVVMKQRMTEPFKGKGIKFKDQIVKKKAGKKN